MHSLHPGYYCYKRIECFSTWNSQTLQIFFLFTKPLHPYLKPLFVTRGLTIVGKLPTIPAQCVVCHISFNHLNYQCNAVRVSRFSRKASDSRLTSVRMKWTKGECLHLSVLGRHDLRHCNAIYSVVPTVQSNIYYNAGASLCAGVLSQMASDDTLHFAEEYRGL